MTRRRLAERALETIMSAHAAIRRGRAQQGRLRAQQVLLFALLRPPVQELLRRSRGLTAVGFRRPAAILLGVTLFAFAGEYDWMAYPLAAAALVLAIAVRPALAPPGSRWLDARAPALRRGRRPVSSSRCRPASASRSPRPRASSTSMLRLGDARPSRSRHAASALDQSGGRQSIARAGHDRAPAVLVRADALRARRRAPVRPLDRGAGPRCWRRSGSRST